MKRLGIIFILLIAWVTTYGQNLKTDSHNFEVMCRLGNIRSEFTSMLKETALSSVSISYDYKIGNRIGVGVGGGYDALKLAPMPGAISNDFNCKEWSVFGTIRGYLPTASKWLDITGVLDMGVAYLDAEIKSVPKEVFVYSPQLGVRFNTSDICGVDINMRLFYKGYPKLEAGAFGFMIGLSF